MVDVHGLEALEGETAFAFMVVRLHTPVDRRGLLEVMRYIAPLIPDADAFIEEFPEELDGALRIVGIPWGPADAGMAVDVQRRLIEGADSVGVEAAWFFQTGTCLPMPDDDEEVEDDEDDDSPDIEDDEGTRVTVRRAPTSTGETHRAPTSTTGTFMVLPTQVAVSGEIGGSSDPTDTAVVAVPDDEAEQEPGDDDEIGAVIRQPGETDPGGPAWTHGLPQQAREVRFPVDEYPEIIEDLDWEDFGIAFKLAGSVLPGESTVLLGFHTLWLAPYGDRYRNTAVTVDPVHHSAHLWVDRFAVPCRPEELVHHLLWIVAKLDEVVPVLHARFAPATVEQKYSAMEDEPPAPFVLGGNPLLAIYRSGGEPGVDSWLASQTDWSSEEVALMLRELAVEIVSAEGPDDDDDDEPPPAERGAAIEDGSDDDEGEAEDEDDDDEDEDDDDDDDPEGDDEDRGRHIAKQAADLLRARALAGKLDHRAGDALLSRLRKPEPPRSVVEVIGAARHRNAVPALIAILEQSVDDRLVAATANALGAIGDARAVPALCDIAAAPGVFVAKPAAAAALANCLASARDARTLDDAELADALAAIVEAGEGQLDPVTCFAVGRIARLLPPHRRAEARRRIQDLDPAGPEPEAQLAREIALLLASPAVPPPAPPPEARTHLERALSDLEGSRDAVAQRWKLALEIAVTVPEIVDMHSILPLTRVLDPEVRAGAHAVLARLGHPAPVAPIFDVAAAHRLDDGELVRRLDTVHTIGRDTLVAELGRRKLPAARPAIVAACHTAIAAATDGERVLDHDRRLLEAALPILARSPDAEVGAVVDRMAQHPNGVLQKLAKKWQHLRHDDEEIN